MKIRWRGILFIGLVWAGIVDGPGACELIRAHWRPQTCNPRLVITCEY
jgi:hypothetical protein